MITAAQIRAARALVGLSQDGLAADSKLSLSTIAAIESDSASTEPQAVSAVRAALEARGVLFLSSGNQDSGGAGVRLKAWNEDEGTRPENLNATNDD